MLTLAESFLVLIAVAIAIFAFLLGRHIERFEDDWEDNDSFDDYDYR